MVGATVLAVRFLVVLLLALTATSSPACATTVLCYGDSIALESCATFAALRPDLAVVNGGRAMDRSVNFARFQSLYDATRPDVVVIYSTTNDIGPLAGGSLDYPPRQTARNLLAMARYARAARVILLTTTPVTPPAYIADLRQAHGVAVAHTLIAHTFGRRRGPELADLLAEFSTHPWVSTDGLHPDDASEQVIAQFLSARIH